MTNGYQDLWEAMRAHLEVCAKLDESIRCEYMLELMAIMEKARFRYESNTVL
jgi:hypothetical protein